MPETFNSQPLCARSIAQGLNIDDRLRIQRFRMHVSRVTQGHNLEQDVTGSSVGTFDRIVVKNGATLTLIDKHAVFLFTVEANLDQSDEACISCLLTATTAARPQRRRLRLATID